MAARWLVPDAPTAGRDALSLEENGMMTQVGGTFADPEGVILLHGRWGASTNTAVDTANAAERDMREIRYRAETAAIPSSGTLDYSEAHGGSPVLKREDTPHVLVSNSIA